MANFLLTPSSELLVVFPQPGVVWVFFCVSLSLHTNLQHSFPFTLYVYSRLRNLTHFMSIHSQIKHNHYLVFAPSLRGVALVEQTYRHPYLYKRQYDIDEHQVWRPSTPRSQPKLREREGSPPVKTHLSPIKTLLNHKKQVF